MKKGDKWGTAEVKVLLSKGFEFIEIIKLERKDTQTMEQKKMVWQRVAASVNAVNTTETIRTWKDCCGKWSQLKCKAKGDLDVMKESIKLGFDG